MVRDYLSTFLFLKDLFYVLFFLDKLGSIDADVCLLLGFHYLQNVYIWSPCDIFILCKVFVPHLSVANEAQGNIQIE